MRQRETNRERYTPRKTEIHKSRQADTKRDRCRDRQTDRQTDRDG